MAILHHLVCSAVNFLTNKTLANAEIVKTGG